MSRRRSGLAFFSYRKQDSFYVASWLADSLAAHFGADKVFIDRKQILAGDKWPARIQKALQQASALLVVIGPNWLRIQDEHGYRRLDQESDWVRKEVLYALQAKVLIVPLLVSGASLPPKAGLPSSLTPLTERQFLELRERQWDSDRSVLLQRLEQAGFQRLSTASPLPRLADDAANRQKVFARQLSALTKAVELVYRARNAARTLCRNPLDTLAIKRNGPLHQLRSHHEAIEDLLYKAGALLPKHIFDVLHRLKHGFIGFSSEVQEAHRAIERTGRTKQIVSTIKKLYQEVDRDYALLHSLVQASLGVDPL